MYVGCVSVTHMLRFAAVSRVFDLDFILGESGLVSSLICFVSRFEDEFLLRGEVSNILLVPSRFL